LKSFLSLADFFPESTQLVAQRRPTYKGAVITYWLYRRLKFAVNSVNFHSIYLF
jgi:hypothetical protein